MQEDFAPTIKSEEKPKKKEKAVEIPKPNPLGSLGSALKETPDILIKFCDFLMSRPVIRIGTGKEEVGRSLLMTRLEEFLKQP